MQDRIENQASAGGTFPEDGVLNARKGKPNAGLRKSSRKGGGRAGNLRTSRRTAVRRMESLGGFGSRRAVQRTRSREARALAASHLALRFVGLRQQRHHRRRSKKQDQRERDGVSSAIHLFAVYNPACVLQQPK
jgi:hypothetical protein